MDAFLLIYTGFREKSLRKGGSYGKISLSAVCRRRLLAVSEERQRAWDTAIYLRRVFLCKNPILRGTRDG